MTTKLSRSRRILLALAATAAVGASAGVGSATALNVTSVQSSQTESVTTISYKLPPGMMPLGRTWS